MAQYELTLFQDLPGEEFSTAEIRYTYNDETKEVWPVVECEPKNNTAAVTVDIVSTLPTVNVRSRALACTYKNENGLRTENFKILTVRPAGDTSELAATLYRVRIVMPEETVNALTRGGYRLYGFKAVKTAVRDASPLGWFQAKNFGLNTDLPWEEEFEAYTSQTEIKEGATIRPINSYKINLGQTLEVTGTNGTGTVYSRGTPGAIDILNKTSTRFTSGISQTPPGGGSATPLYAFDLYKDFRNSTIPIAKVLLLFANKEVNTGTVILHSYGPGILIDLSGAAQRQVNYALDSGWTWGGGTWAKEVPSGTAINPLLINNPLGS